MTASFKTYLHEMVGRNIYHPQGKCLSLLGIRLSIAKPEPQALSVSNAMEQRHPGMTQSKYFMKFDITMQYYTSNWMLIDDCFSPIANELAITSVLASMC